MDALSRYCYDNWRSPRT